jgi:hypothetical protein
VIPQSKPQVQGAFFDLLVAMDPSVGDIVEIGLGLCWTALMQHHNLDSAKASTSMREAMDQVLDQVPKIQPMAIMPGTKLDS